MKRTAFLFALAVLPALVAAPVSGAAEKTSAEVENSPVVQTDRQRIEAMVRNDAGACGALLADELVYGHADGRVQTKAELLTALRENQTQYRFRGYGDLVMAAVGEARSLSGRAEFEASAGGTSAQFSIRFLAVYVNRDGAGWKLIAYQSTPVRRQG